MIEITRNPKHKKGITVMMATRKVGATNLTKPMKQFTVYGMTIDEIFGIVYCAVEDYMRKEGQK